MTQYQATILIGFMLLCLPFGIFTFITIPWLKNRLMRIVRDTNKAKPKPSEPEHILVLKYRYNYQNSDNQPLVNH